MDAERPYWVRDPPAVAPRRRETAGDRPRPPRPASSSIPNGVLTVHFRGPGHARAGCVALSAAGGRGHAEASTPTPCPYRAVRHPFNLNIGDFIHLHGPGPAGPITVNGTLPAPLARGRHGDPRRPAPCRKARSTATRSSSSTAMAGRRAAPRAPRWSASTAARPSFATSSTSSMHADRYHSHSAFQEQLGLASAPSSTRAQPLALCDHRAPR